MDWYDEETRTSMICSSHQKEDFEEAGITNIRDNVIMINCMYTTRCENLWKWSRAYIRRFQMVVGKKSRAMQEKENT